MYCWICFPKSSNAFGLSSDSWNLAWIGWPRVWNKVQQISKTMQHHNMILQDVTECINISELLGTFTLLSTYREDWVFLNPVLLQVYRRSAPHILKQTKSFVTTESADPRQVSTWTKFSRFSKSPWECKNHLPSIPSIYQYKFVWVGLHHLHKANFLYLPASAWNYFDPKAIHTK